MSIDPSVLRALADLPELHGFRVCGDAVVSTTTEGNDLAIFVQELPWSTPPRPPLIITYGVRLGRLIRFDSHVLRIRTSRWPRLGRLHYERSLGWLLQREEPVFGGSAGAPDVAEQMRPFMVRHVIPDLVAHASEEAVAEALLNNDPLQSLPRHELRQGVMTGAPGHPSVG